MRGRPRWTITAGLALVAALAGGCGSKEDPFTADIKLICNAGQSRPDLPPPMRRLQAMHEIAGKIRTGEAARLMGEITRARADQRVELMRPAMARAGLAHCPLLEM